jgi:PAS domain S-box-containing protein
VHYIVTLMRRSVVEARSAHESARDILDATSEAIIIHAADDGGVVSVNATALAMFGYSRSEFLGLAPQSLMMTPEVDGPRFTTSCTDASCGKNVAPIDWQARRKDGSTFWVEVAIRSALISGQARLIAVARDTSRRRRLEQRVREAETFRAVGQLAGGVAHDFNNQLVGILGNAEFLRDELSVDADLSGCADAIIASGRRAADLTQQLLAFARRGRLRNVAVDMHQIIREVVALSKRSIDKRISIDQDLEATEYAVLGDPSALQNALLNLLLNARDALPHGGTIRFTTRIADSSLIGARTATKSKSETRDSDAVMRTLQRARDSAAGRALPWDAQPAAIPTTAVSQYLEISVTDTGMGVEPALRERIFEPFFTTKESGTGMGLAAVRGTLDEHHGWVELHSEIGKGSTFRLFLPLSSEPRQPQIAYTSEKNVRSSGRILVVDDEAAVAKVCKMALERGGFQVEVCSGGHQALQCYRTNRFDLVLLDVMMPDIDGVEVLQRVRRMDPSAKVVLMTGNASESVEARLKEQTDVLVLSKPMMPKELLEFVRHHLAI